MDEVKKQNENMLERVRPEQVGVLSQGILDFLKTVKEKNINMHCFMLLRHGKVAAEGYFRPFDGKHVHNIYSVSKSVTSAAIGIAAGDGLLTLEDRVIDYFPEKLAPNVHEYTAMMKIKHLLSMSTVHHKSTDTKGDDWVGSFLNTPPSHMPGTIFAYDTTGVHTLCAIIQKVTGKTVLEYLSEKLFEPIGMGKIEWESCPMGINKGGSGIKCTIEDMARFGQLYLQDGVWNGKRILPDGWVSLSTSRHIDNTNTKFLLDGQKGYGYLFWRTRNNSYTAFGMGGQFVVVIPEKDAVFVSTANTLLYRDGHQLILDSLWETLYPAMSEGTCPNDNAAYEKMRYELDNLALILPEGKSYSYVADRVSGRHYRLDENKLEYDACEFVFGEDKSKLRLIKNGSVCEIDFGMGRWIMGSEPFLGYKSANAGIWVDENTCIIHMQIFDCLQMFILTCRFEEGCLVIQIQPAGAEKADGFQCYLNGRHV